MGKYIVEVTETIVGHVVVEAESPSDAMAGISPGELMVLGGYTVSGLVLRALREFGQGCLSNVRSLGYVIHSVERIRDDEADATLSPKDFD